MMTMKTIADHSNEAYASLSSRGLEFLDLAMDRFPDYLSGRAFRFPDEMEYHLLSSGLEDGERMRIRQYCFAENILSSAGSIGRNFTSLYETHRHDPEYTLDKFMSCWREDARQFSQNGTGDHADTLRNLIELLEVDNALSGFISRRDGRIYGGSSLPALAVEAVLIENADLAADLFITALPADMRKDVHEIAYDVRLAQESGKYFLEASQKMHGDRRFSLQNFLMYYNEKGRIKKTNIGKYFPMFKRLVMRSTSDWREHYYSLLRDPVKSRVAALEKDLAAKSGILQEEEIRLLEALLSKGSVPYLISMAEEGSDAEDLLAALHLDKLTPHETRVLREILRKGRNKIRQYLGILSVNVPDSAASYDWGSNIKDIAERIKPEDFARNEVLAAILYNKERQKWDPMFREDSKTALEIMRTETEDPNPVYRAIMQKVLAHFELRQRVSSDVKGVVKQLRVRK